MDSLKLPSWRTNENFRETPRRVSSFYKELLERMRPEIKVFPSSSNEMVVLKDFVDYSLCPHHLLPVRYVFRVGYIPTGQVIGLSKIPRIIHYLMSKLPLQEDIPDLVVQELVELLRPMGCGCQVRGRHMCMEMRGVKTEGEFVTTKLTGVILLNPGTHEEFLTC
jgi:GTP cyclohydrolase I